MSQTHLLLVLLALYSFLVSTNGRTICGSSGDSYDHTPSWDQETQSSSDSMDRLGTIGVSCETSGGEYGGGGSVSSSSNNHLAVILGVAIPIFIILWVIVGVYIICVQRRKSAATIADHNPGQQGEVEMPRETNWKAYPAATNQIGQPMTNQQS